MNTRIKELAETALEYAEKNQSADIPQHWFRLYNEKFAELIVQECAGICMEMSAKCAGLEGDGALAKDCADWIKKDFGIEPDVNENLRNRSTYFGNDI